MRTIHFCLFCLFISVSYSQTTDYSLSNNWAALPGNSSNASWVPEDTDLKDLQDSAKADVFYIHPTTHLVGYKGNSSIDNRNVNNSTDEGPIKYQASVFNGSCKIYAPRYQQAVLHNFFTKDSEASKQAFNVAYQDVKAAFQYYLEHYNQGRPIIIAGHSQGAMHAKTLLKEFFEGKPLGKQLVAAYVIGYPVEKGYFSSLQPCGDSTQTDCFITYSTFGEGTKSDWFDYSQMLCVNPLSWKADEDYVGSKAHLGGINKKMVGIATQLTGCRCDGGKLLVHKPEENGFIPLAGKNYHLYDYQLFYMNIRKNVHDRITEFLKNKPQ